MSIKAAAAASARFESNVAAVHPYESVGDKGLLVDTLDTVRDEDSVAFEHYRIKLR
jgi:hypothetical protein